MAIPANLIRLVYPGKSFVKNDFSGTHSGSARYGSFVADEPRNSASEMATRAAELLKSIGWGPAKFHYQIVVNDEFYYELIAFENAEGEVVLVAFEDPNARESWVTPTTTIYVTDGITDEDLETLFGCAFLHELPRGSDEAADQVADQPF